MSEGRGWGGLENRIEEKMRGRECKRRVLRVPHLDGH